MKRILTVLTVLCLTAFCSLNSYAAANLFAPKPVVYTGACTSSPKPVKSDTEANFCSDFKATVQCQCQFFTGSSCGTMKDIYNNMIGEYGLEGGCKFAYAMQWASSVQSCKDQWRCYRNGGKDSKGGLCSEDGHACPAS